MRYEIHKSVSNDSDEYDILYMASSLKNLKNNMDFFVHVEKHSPDELRMVKISKSGIVTVIPYLVN